jgi:hypothetical protein
MDMIWCNILKCCDLYILKIGITDPLKAANCVLLWCQLLCLVIYRSKDAHRASSSEYLKIIKTASFQTFAIFIWFEHLCFSFVMKITDLFTINRYKKSKYQKEMQKKVTVVIKNWLIATKYPFLKWQWIFSAICRFLLSSITD